MEIYFNGDIDEGKWKASVDFIYPKGGPGAGYYGMMHTDEARTEKIHFCASKGKGHGMVSMEDKKFLTPSVDPRMATVKGKPPTLFGGTKGDIADSFAIADLFGLEATVHIES